MISRRGLVIIIMVAIGAIASAVVLSYLKGSQSSLQEEAELSVSGVELNRRANTLTGVNVTSSASSTVAINGASLVKIQSGITVASKSFPEHIQVAPSSQIYIPIGFSLDPEGADYFLYLKTDRGTVIKFRLSYP
ncbi:MAG: hypothetical protein QFX35_04230 [Candidatus Verstraetearchaeota archaeon]|nr:hypothetical protein [Candidatus Verstraetearchaeota archaeon]